ASLAHIWMIADSTIPSIGASVAISAVLGAYLIMFPRSRIKLVFLIFFVTFYISAIIFIGFWFIQQFMSAYIETGLDARTQGVAWWSHIGRILICIISAIHYQSRARELSLTPNEAY